MSYYSYTTASTTGTYTAYVYVTSSAGDGDTMNSPESKMLSQVKMQRQVADALSECTAPDVWKPIPWASVIESPSTLTDVEQLRRSNAEAKRLVGLVRKSPSCVDCVCFREVVDTEKNRFGKTVVTQSRRMCAHPAYSQPHTDFTEARLEFIPKFTCEQSRAEGTVCGPTGRLFISAQPGAFRVAGKSVWAWTRRQDIGAIILYSFMIYMIAKGVVSIVGALL